MPGTTSADPSTALGMTRDVIPSERSESRDPHLPTHRSTNQLTRDPTHQVTNSASSKGSRRPRYPASVLNVLALGQEHSVLADVRRQVGDALEVAAHQEVLERGVDGARVRHHVGEEDAEYRLVQGIHLVVARADVAAERPIGAEEGVDR